eukprot:SM003931S15161  [mRNA]  locus=s3931:793:1319:+ [translate_table: standard]
MVWPDVCILGLLSAAPSGQRARHGSCSSRCADANAVLGSGRADADATVMHSWRRRLQTLLCEVKGRDQLLGWAKIPMRDHAPAAKPKPRAMTEHRLVSGLSSDAAAGVLTLTLAYHDRCGG